MGETVSAGWQRAFVLHSRPFSETSLLIDFFTEGEGKIRLLAKGARRNRSPLRGCLQPFTPLLIRWGGKGEIKTLTHAIRFHSRCHYRVLCFIAVYISMS